MKNGRVRYRHLDFSLDEINLGQQLLEADEVHKLVEQQMKTIEKIRAEINKTFQKVASMQYTAEMMRNLMRDLLDLAQLENKSFKINEEFFNLHEVIKSAFQVVGFQADRQKIKLRDPNLALNEYEIFKKIRGDSRRYLQIMINFLSNALKFSNRSSEIRINIRLNEMIAKATSSNGSPKAGQDPLEEEP